MQIKDVLHFSESMLFPVWTLDLHGDAGAQLFGSVHWHTELEFITITEGSCTLYVDGQAYALKKNHAFFVHESLLHQAIAGEEGCSVCGFIFSKALLTSKEKLYVDNQFWDTVFSEQFGLICHTYGEQEWEKKVAAAILDVFRLCKACRFAYELLVKARIDEIFYLLIRNTTSAKQPKRSSVFSRDELWEEIVSYIKSNLQHPLSVADISNAFQISERSIYRCASQHETTMSAVINRCRVEEGARRLVNSSQPITQIAMDIGFSDSSYFAAVFKTFYGCSPVQYRKQNAKLENAEVTPRHG